MALLFAEYPDRNLFARPIDADGETEMGNLGAEEQCPVFLIFYPLASEHTDIGPHRLRAASAANRPHDINGRPALPLHRRNEIKDILLSETEAVFALSRQQGYRRLGQCGISAERGPARLLTLRVDGCEYKFHLLHRRDGLGLSSSSRGIRTWPGEILYRIEVAERIHGNAEPEFVIPRSRMFLR